MGIADFIKGQFTDVIEHVDESNKLLVYKYVREGDEIKQGADLIVRPGQAAVFVHQGRIADIFAPGHYTLDTDNLPVLSSLEAMDKAFRSPLKSDLYFLNTTQFINNRWGTKNPIILRDKDLHMVRITAFGTYAFRITDPVLFMNELFGARRLNMTYDILQFLNSFVTESIATCLGESQIPILDLATQYRNLSAGVCKYVNEKIHKFGIELSDTVIENIALPEEVEQMIDEQSGIGMASKDMGTFMQYQTARAMRDASKQDGGLAGLGAGLAFGQQIAGSFSDAAAPQAEHETVSDPKNEDDDTDPVIDKLLEYKKLLDSGILTEEEFAEVKKSLLKTL